jgi:hypothetical protein
MTTAPATRAARSRSAPPTTADRVRAWAVLLALPITIAAAALGGGLFGGQEVGSSAGGALSDAATPIAPDGPAFSIWSVIYLGLAAYAVWQVLPKQHADRRQQATGWLAIASLVLNAAWILAAQSDVLWLTEVVIVVLLAVLTAIFVLLRRGRPDSWVEAIVVDGTFGLYLGWVSVATAANTAALLADLGVQPEPFEPWAIAVLAVVALVGVALAVWSRGRIAPALAMTWGLAWIAAGRFAGAPESASTGIAAIVAAALIVGATVLARMRDQRR